MTDDTAQVGQTEQLSEQEQEQLAEAAATLAQMTPEALLEMQHYQKALEDAVTLPEAAGIAFCELYGENGNRVNLTARGFSPADALDKLVRGIRYARTLKLNVVQQKLPTPTPTPAQQAQPAQGNLPAPKPAQPALVPPAQMPQQAQYVPVGAEDVTFLQVDAIEHKVSKNNTHYLTVYTVKGTGYSMYGASAWPKFFPPGFDINQYSPGPPPPRYDPPDDMAYATIGKVMGKDGKSHTKVLSFSAAP